MTHDLIKMPSPFAGARMAICGSLSRFSNRIQCLLACFVVVLLSACDSGTDSPAGTGESATDTQAGEAREPAASASDGAEDADGTITAVVNGTERTWYITSTELHGEYVSQSDWTPLYASSVGVTLFGHDAPSSTRTADGVILSFTLHGSGAAATAENASVTYLSGGIMNNHSSDHDGGHAVVAVERAEFDGEMLEVAGTFSGTLPFKSRDESADPATRETLTLENGSFQGVVRQLQLD